MKNIDKETNRQERQERKGNTNSQFAMTRRLFLANASLSQARYRYANAIRN
ncbi:hypothetical protein [Nostoc piscinale]|uniref:hypothetical protein n=1 Tax=Nostoc piscinale TaxID=224012 RepID=UPI000AC777D7|nr:hypothetical protein [Nostoc piscinale]